MRRGLLIGLGAIAALLWWQPWRRWTQSQPAEQSNSRGAFTPPRSSGPAAASPYPSSPSAPSRPSIDDRYTIARQGVDASAENSGAVDSPADFSEFATSANIPGMSSPPSSPAETSFGDLAASGMEGDTSAQAQNSTSGSQASDTGTTRATESETGSETGDTGDDLDRLEGIGPKTSSILRAAGITTFSQIAETEAERLHQIVREGGITTANPTTWPMQARLAAEAKWDELKELQEEIKNGRLSR